MNPMNKRNLDLNPNKNWWGLLFLFLTLQYYSTGVRVYIFDTPFKSIIKYLCYLFFNDRIINIKLIKIRIKEWLLRNLCKTMDKVTFIYNLKTIHKNNNLKKILLRFAPYGIGLIVGNILFHLKGILCGVTYLNKKKLFSIFLQGSKVIRQSPINWCTSKMNELLHITKHQ